MSLLLGAAGPGDSTPHGALQSPEWLEHLRAVDAAAALGTLGRFQLHAEAGRGGQGIVYRALDPQSSRIVALKRFTSGGRNGGAMHLHLQKELRILRALDHPGIVRVLDVASDGECPLLVLEWVDGRSMTAWSAGHGQRQPVRAIVQLMARVCEVVLHAHQRGIIHRDLKPSNILVDAADMPHLLDFGLAKLREPTNDAYATSARFLGTLAYAAPELVEGGPSAVDARSDVYALGVILHEMLTGALPYALGASISSAVEAIRRDAPGGLRAAGIDEPLQAVVRRGLAKRPEDRYQSADAFLADLRRWLAGETVEARTHGGWQALCALARRHRPAFTVAAIALAGISVFAATMTVLYHRAERAAHRAQRIEGFLTSAFGGREAPWSAVDLADVLARGAERASRELAGEPEVEAGVRILLARRYAELGMWPDVIRQCERAIALSAGDSEQDANAIFALGYLGYGRVLMGQPQGEAQLRRAVELARARADADPQLLAGLCSTLAYVHWRFSRAPYAALAEAEYQEAFASLRRGPPASHDWIWTLRGYALMKLRRGQFDAALASFEQAIAMLAQLPDEALVTRTLLFEGKADVLLLQRQWAAAERVLRAAIELRHGALDDRLPPCWAKLGDAVVAQGRRSEALLDYQTAIVCRCERLAQRLPQQREGFLEHAAIIRREGLHSIQVQPLLGLLRDHAPEIAPLLRYTTGRIADVRESMGDATGARAFRAALGATPQGPSHSWPPAFEIGL